MLYTASAKATAHLDMLMAFTWAMPIPAVYQAFTWPGNADIAAVYQASTERYKLPKLCPLFRCYFITRETKL